VSAFCNARGQCQCLPGITGDKCDGCQPRYAVEDGKCVCKFIDTSLLGLLIKLMSPIEVGCHSSSIDN
jgi:hypothetical protein